MATSRQARKARPRKRDCAAIRELRLAALEGLESRVMLVATPATLGLGTLSSSPRQLVDLGAVTLFTTSAPTNQLWRTDGTAVGTAMLKDFGTAAADAPQNLRAAGILNSKLYFAAGSGTGTELWVTDGTALGTVQLKEIAPGSASSSPASFRSVGNVVYFVANDGTTGSELWKTDGTAAGTTQVKDIYVGSGASDPTWMTDFGGKLYFSAADATFGRELWQSDGTANGTFAVSDIYPGSASAQVSGLALFGGKLLFSALDPTHGYELWESDGTTNGTVIVADINPGTASSQPVGLTISGGQLYFSAADANAGRELFVSDGTTAGTKLALDINPGSPASSPTSLVDLNGRLMFLANSGTGNKLWAYDGLSGAELPAAPTSSPTVFGNRVYFSSADVAAGAELWSSDGTVPGTARLTDLTPGPDGANVVVLGPSGSWLYFAAENGLLGQELYKVDAGGAVNLVSDVNTTPNPAQPVNPTVFNGAIYFAGSTGGVYRSDGTPGGLTRISAQNAGRFAVANNTLFFSVGDVTQYPALWKTDGTAAGTQLVKSYPLPTNYAGSIGTMWSWNNRLYFVPPVEHGLWASDGTPAGTVAVQSATATTRTITANTFTPVGSNAYFFGYDGTHSAEPWRTDGTDAGTFMVRDIQASGGSVSNGDIEDLNGVAIFPALSGTYNFELYRSDPYTTVMITDINGTGDASLRLDPRDVSDTLVRLGNYVYFFSSNTLYRTDGTGVGTVAVSRPFSYFDNLFGLTRVGNRLFFVVQPKSIDSEYDLYTSDGTADGTVLLRRFHTDGAYNSRGISDIVDINGIAYFTGWNVNDGTGYELWRSDGTTAGTQLVADINPGAAVSSPGVPFLFNGDVYVVATNSTTGTGLWRISPATLPPVPTGLTAVASSPVHINLTWALNSAEQSGFVLERSRSATFATIEDTIPLPPGARSYVDPVVSADTVYYYRLRTYNAAGNSNWATATATTTPLSWPTGTVSLDPGSSYPTVRALLPFKDQIYASVGIPATNQLRLVRSDGTTLTSVATEFFGPVVLGDSVIFFKEKSLWRTDGTDTNTVKIADLTQPNYSGFVFQGRFYFLDGPYGDLWQTDGTAAGTSQVVQVTDQRLQVLRKALADYNAVENDHVFLGNTLYYKALAASGGIQIFKTDGTTTTQVTNVQLVSPYFGWGYPSQLAAVNGSIYFFAQQTNPHPTDPSEQNIALWRTDGTPQGTQQVHKLDRDQYYGSIVSANGTIYFSTKSTLWTSDGSDAGTFLLKSNPGDPGISNLTPLGSRLYFVTRTYAGTDSKGNAVYDRRLNVSDGTVAGTVLVPGTPDAPTVLTPSGDSLYFAAGTQGLLYRYTPAAVAQPPAPPGNLVTTVFSAGEIDLAWVDSSRNEEGFVLERSRSATFSTIEASFTLLPNTARFADTGLAPLTTYYYRIRAFNTDGVSVNVVTSPATTTAGPAAPTALIPTNTQPGEKVTLQWTDNATNETSYVVQRSANFDFLPSSAIDLNITLPANTTTYLDTTVDRLTKYYYRVFAVNAEGNSPAASTTITTPESRPKAVTSLRVFAVSSSQIDLQWQDNAVNEYSANGYVIERALGTGTFTVIAQLPANSTTYSDGGLQSGRQYTYRLRAVNAVGYSDEVLSSPTQPLPPGLTTKVKQISSLAGAHPDKFIAIGTTVYFVASTVSSPNLDDFSGTELWRTDGQPGTTIKLFTGPVKDLTSFGGKLYFVSGTRVYQSDGSAAGTTQLIDLASAGKIYVSLLGASSSKLFLLTSDGMQAQIWKSDGTSASFASVGVVPNGSNSFVISGAWLYFLDGNNFGQNFGGDLWRTDGSGAPVQMAGIAAIEQMIDVNGTLYAFGRPALAIHEIDLFSISQSASTATIVKQILNYDSYPTGITTLTKVGNGLYFAAPDGINAQVLWKSDGTAAGTVPVFDPVENTILGQYGRTWAIADVAGAVYFISTDLYNAQPGPTGWLWKTDGTTAGTVRIRAVNVPEIIPYGARPLYLTAVDGKAIYCDGDYLWRSDGTLEGTVQIDRNATASDGARSSAWFSGAPFAVVGDQIFFGGAVPGDSQELRVAYLHAPGNPTNLTISQPASPSAPIGDIVPSASPIPGLVLNWRDQSGNESGFAIDRSTRADFATLDQTFFTAPDITTFTDGSATLGANWFYRVRAVNAGGVSAYTNSVTAAPPSVLSSSFDSTAQRLTVQFSTDVSSSLSATDAYLTNLTTGQVISTSAIFLVSDYSSSLATISFPGLANSKLPVGNYRLTLRSSDISSPLGLALDGDGDGVAGGDYSYDFQMQATGGYAGTPFNGVPTTIVPGSITTLQAEHFDNGGDGTAWHDTDTGNVGGNTYRSTSVDLGSTTDGGTGGVIVNFAHAGEWLTYTIKVLAPGDYNLSLRAASLRIGGTLHVEIDGVRTGATITIPDTGAWTTWQNVSLGKVSLPEGVHAIKLSFDTNGSIGYVGDLNYLTFTPVSPIRHGDANHDGQVDVSDLALLAAHYGSSYGTWVAGDFNGDWIVDVSDLALLAANYGTIGPAPSAPVEESPVTESIQPAANTPAASIPVESAVSVVVAPRAALAPLKSATVVTTVSKTATPAPAKTAAGAMQTIPSRAIISPPPSLTAVTKKPTQANHRNPIFAVAPVIKPTSAPRITRKR